MSEDQNVEHEHKNENEHDHKELMIKGTKDDDILLGGAGDDKLHGNHGDDVIWGGEGNDDIAGDKGDDFLNGGAGDDKLHGGHGYDTAVFSGDIQGYSFSLKDEGKLYVDGQDGHDELKHIEALQFDNVTVVVGGDSNNSILTVDDAVSFDEDSAPASVNLIANDWDYERDGLGMNVTFTMTSLDTGDYTGGAAFDPATGIVTFTPDTTAYQYLAVGESETIVMTYEVSDGEATSVGTLTVIVTGSNDVPIVHADTGTVDEDSSGISGNLLDNDSDVDVSDVLSVVNAGTHALTYGDLAISSDGSWLFIPNAAAQDLNDGDTMNETFTVEISDGHSSVSSALTLTVTGITDVTADPVVVAINAEGNPQSAAANGAAGIAGTQADFGGVGENGADSDATQTVYSDTSHSGGSGDDDISIAVLNYGIRAGDGGAGGQGWNADFYLTDSLWDKAYTYNYYQYNHGNRGGLGGDGGHAASSTALIADNSIAANAGADTILLETRAFGRVGGDAGDGGDGGSAGSFKTVKTPYEYTTPWGTTYQATQYDIYSEGKQGRGGNGGNGGDGGDGIASTLDNHVMGGAGDDSITIDSKGLGVSGGDGGYGGSARGTAQSVNVIYYQPVLGHRDGTNGDGGDAGNSGDGFVEVIGNILDGGAGDDHLTLELSAYGGNGGRGGSSFPARNGSDWSTWYGVGGVGGNGGNGGDAFMVVDQNTLLGGDGNDILEIDVLSYGGWGGPGGNAEGGRGHSGTRGRAYVQITDNILSGGAGDDLFIFDVLTTNRVGSFVISGNVIDGGSGTDKLDLSKMSVGVTMDMGAGTFSFAGGGNNSLSSIEIVHGSMGDDQITGSDNGEILRGREGDDVIFGAGGDDDIRGSEGNDIISGGAGNDEVRGGHDDDVMSGGAGDDEVRGGSGNDILNGGTGDDILYGGIGDDIFVFDVNSGADIITDFEKGDNTLDLSAYTISDVNGDSVIDMNDLSISQNGADTVIDLGDGNSIVLMGILASTLTDADFILM